MVCSLAACGGPEGNEALQKNIYIELVDWHISGLWVINAPVAWVRVKNYNNVPVKDVTIQYTTFDFDGTQLDQGNTTLGEGAEVPAGQVKNFIEQYLGLVNLRSQKLMVKLVSVTQV
ncbi:MAG TPA: hypothetical protein V6C69_12105 [Trichormus sp.]|jgi:hypothetical protein